jgi:hypothetical protein
MLAWVVGIAFPGYILSLLSFLSITRQSAEVVILFILEINSCPNLIYLTCEKKRLADSMHYYLYLRSFKSPSYSQHISILNRNAPMEISIQPMVNHYSPRRLLNGH